ncbi:MAG: formate dehydrogenase subunit delta, partial [Parahaliea sp.]
GGVTPMSAAWAHNLVRMANQIADNLQYGPGGELEAVERVATHLRRFWNPDMRAQLAACAQQDGVTLKPIVLAALTSL